VKTIKNAFGKYSVRVFETGVHAYMLFSKQVPQISSNVRCAVPNIDGV
jgi:hypothetical protein